MLASKNKMKYELEPDNRDCADEVLLNDLKIVASRLATMSLTKEEYDQNGRFCSATMRKRFGSWNQALERSGLAVQKRMNINKQELLADLKRVAKDIGMESVPRESYRRFGHFADATLVRTYGSWGKALIAAGLAKTGWKPKATEEELFTNMAQVWEYTGKQPKQSDFYPPVSRFSHSTYVNRYGSWRKALEEFVQAANGNAPQDEAPQPDKPNAQVPPPTEHKHTTPRNPSWRLRFLVMRRDHFKCQKCGRSPALQSGIILHVDHRKAWTKGGETVDENLLTLCEQCNIGKSNLDETEER